MTGTKSNGGKAVKRKDATSAVHGKKQSSQVINAEQSSADTCGQKAPKRLKASGTCSKQNAEKEARLTMILGMKNIIDAESKEIEQDEGGQRPHSQPPTTCETSSQMSANPKTPLGPQVQISSSHQDPYMVIGQAEGDPIPQLQAPTSSEPASLSTSANQNTPPGPPDQIPAINLLEDEEITTFLEMESHRMQINQLQEQVATLKEELRKSESEKSSLANQVVELKLIIADNFISTTPGKKPEQALDDSFYSKTSSDVDSALDDTMDSKISDIDIPAHDDSDEDIAAHDDSDVDIAAHDDSDEDIADVCPDKVMGPTKPASIIPTPSMSSKIAEPEKSSQATNQVQDDLETKLLVNDPANPGKYAAIRVSRSGYRTMISRACKAKESCKKLLNEAMELVFSREEMACSSGMGKRKDRKGRQNPLDPLKIEAVLDFTRSYSTSQKWEIPAEKDLHRVITNKVTNSRRN